MKGPITVNFKDLDTSSNGFAIIQSDESSVAIAFSLETNGDIQVVMEKESAKELLEALQKALSPE